MFLFFTGSIQNVFVFFEPENLNSVFVIKHLSLFQWNLPVGCDAFQTHQLKQQNFDCFLQVI